MISDTIKKIKDARAIVVKDLPADPRVWAGFQMAQAQAKRELPDFLDALAGEIQSVAVPVFVSGANALEFANEMAALSPAAVVNLDGIYKALHDAVAPSIGRDKTFNVTQFMLVVSALRQMAIENGLAAIEVPSFEGPEVVNTDEELDRVILKYADRAVGIELAANYAKTQAAEQAVSLITESVNVFPVFLLNANGSRQNALAKTFRRPVEVKLQAPEVVTAESAEEGLKAVRSAVSPSPNTTNTTATKTNTNPNQKKAKS